MRKKILMGALILSVSLFGAFSLSAANNRVEVVSENDATKQLSPDGMRILNTINTGRSDLVNGNVAIDIIIDNSKNTEVFYVLDNSAEMGTIKNSVVDSIKTGALTLEGLANVKQGIVTTNEGNVSLVNLDSANIGMQLENIKSNTSNGNSQVFDLINKAAENFTNTAEVKVIVVTLASMPTLSSTDVTELTTKIDNYAKQGIKIIVYGINLTNQTNFQTIFASVKDNKFGGVYELTNDKLGEINFLSNVMSYLPSPKPAIATTITYDNYIINNFEIKDVVASQGRASYDSATNRVIWEIETIPSNQVVTLTYFLSLKTVVDESIIESINLRTNRQIVVTQTGQEIGTYPAHDKIDDQICSPTIRILKEAIDNPKTGMVDYIIGGSCMLAVALITIVILNRKNEFNRI